MPLFLLFLGIFLCAVILMAAMLARKHLLLKQGVVFTREDVRAEHVSRLFSSLHDLERSLLKVLFRTVGQVFSHTCVIVHRGATIVIHKTPIERLFDVVSGKKGTNGERSEPSAYLKDMTNHRDQWRENGSRE